MIDHHHLSQCTLPTIEHPAGEQWYRIHRTDLDALFFGPPPGDPPCNRFDDPRGEYQVCYLGLSEYAVFAETLLHSPTRRILSFADIDERSLATIELRRAVTLVQLHGPGLNMLDITADIVDGPYDICGELARALYERDAKVDGIEYRCRHDNDEIAVALFDRTADALEPIASTSLTVHRKLLLDIVERYQIAIS